MKRARSSSSSSEQQQPHFLEKEDEEDVKSDPMRRREEVLRRYAPRIAELAQTALLAIHALINFDDKARAEINEEYGLFCHDENTLIDAERAIRDALDTAEENLPQPE